MPVDDDVHERATRRRRRELKAARDERDAERSVESRAKRRRRVRRGAVVAIAVVVVYLAFTAAQVVAANKWDHTRDADAAIVLGAAQYNGKPSPVFKRRLDRAHALWAAGKVPVIVLTGGRAVGDRYTEAYSGLTYLRKKGVPEKDLIVVDNGSSTWESLAASVRVLRKRGIRQVQLVSDPYHSYRLEAIADEVGLDGKVSPTATTSSSGELFRETVLVAGGRIIGYRRLVNLVE